ARELRRPEDTPPAAGKVTSKASRTTGRAVDTTDVEPATITGGIRGDADVVPIVVGGAGAVQGKRIDQGKRVSTRTSEVTNELTWVAKGELAGEVADLTYGLRIRFDDGVQERGEFRQSGGAVSWRARVGEGEPVGGDAAAADTFSPAKILTGQTRYPNLNGVVAAIREALPAGVLPEDGEPFAPHAAANEAKISR